jgi:FAD dependent oxidoreductase TIGR03364
MKKVGVIGAGICGLAHAWAAAKRGMEVHVFERDSFAQAASIRNFGMIWPIGQPFGELHDLAIESSELWKLASQQAGFWLAQCGSIHLAHHQDEMAVLEEYVRLSGDVGCRRELLNLSQVDRHTSGANRNGLLGGLLSSTECGVNPRNAIESMSCWLSRSGQANFSFSTSVLRVSTVTTGKVELLTGRGERLNFDLVLICSGAETKVLFPERFEGVAFKKCKLQMMSTSAQPDGWQLGPHLASGLTLRHYPSFSVCPTISEVKNRIARENPELDQFGIHVMASQNQFGEIVLGDSHEYDKAIEPFDNFQIDQLILRELQKVFDLPSWEIAKRWHGIYLKYFDGPAWIDKPVPGIRLFTGLGGNGMTLAFGIAERWWANAENWDSDF